LNSTFSRTHGLLIQFPFPGGVSSAVLAVTAARNVAPLLSKYAYCEHPRTAIVQAAHGDASGVRGAAMLWPA
jgi:hypothetical protein